MKKQLKRQILSISIFTVLLLLTTHCVGQRVITFPIAESITDTTGTWFLFATNYDLNIAGKEFNATQKDDSGIIASRLVYLYSHTPSVRSGQLFGLQDSETKHELDVEILRFTPRYGGMKDGRIGVRMEDRQSGEFKLLYFEKVNEEWRYLSSPEDELSYYLRTLSYLVHGKLHSLRIKQNYVLNRIQEACLKYQLSFIIPLSCATHTLKTLVTEDAVKFKSSLSEIDAVSYKK